MCFSCYPVPPTPPPPHLTECPLFNANIPIDENNVNNISASLTACFISYEKKIYPVNMIYDSKPVHFWFWSSFPFLFPTDFSIDSLYIMSTCIGPIGSVELVSPKNWPESQRHRI